ncbi:peptidase M23, partial [Pseudomonas syringae pv. tagetis]
MNQALKQWLRVVFFAAHVGHTRPDIFSHISSVSPIHMLRDLIALALICQLNPAFAEDERVHTQKQIDAAR